MSYLKLVRIRVRLTDVPVYLKLLLDVPLDPEQEHEKAHEEEYELQIVAQSIPVPRHTALVKEVTRQVIGHVQHNREQDRHQNDDWSERCRVVKEVLAPLKEGLAVK